jgi:hypothetical protein
MCPCIFCICYRTWCQFIVSTVVGEEGKGCSWYVPLYIFPYSCIMNLFRNQMYKFHRIFKFVFSCHLPPQYFSIPLHSVSHGTQPMSNIRSTDFTSNYNHTKFLLKKKKILPHTSFRYKTHFPDVQPWHKLRTSHTNIPIAYKKHF